MTLRSPLVLPLLLAPPAVAQCPLDPLATGAAPGDELGAALALAGDRAWVGVPGADAQAGAVRVFHVDGEGWIEEAPLAPATPAAGARFGAALAFGAGRLAVGAPADPGHAAASGAVYLFESDGAGLAQAARLLPPQAGADFGAAVGVDGEWVAVGAPRARAAGVVTGAVYLFRLDALDWKLMQCLELPTPQVDARFGAALELVGERLIVGAPGALAGLGDARVFDFADGAWLESEWLLPPYPQPGAAFGSAVAIDGPRALVGAPLHDGAAADSGAAFLFEWPESPWGEGWTPRDPAASHFGARVALAPTRALVGAPASDAAGALDCGAAYLFEKSEFGWIESTRFEPPVLLAGAAFGSAVSIDDGRALVAPPELGAGEAHTFEQPRALVRFCYCYFTAPCGNPDREAGCATSSGAGALLSVCGSASVTSDDLVLRARGVPAHEFGLMFMGGGQTQVAFGDGNRCVSSGATGVFRFPIARSSADGALTAGPGLVAHSLGFADAGRLRAGDTWNFQCWFRDPGGPCGSAFNLTNGLEITFSP